MLRNAAVLLAAACLPIGMTAQAQIVTDGGFETGTPNAFWDEFSTNFASPICNTQRCGSFFGGAFEGLWWAWFGGATLPEIGSLTQPVTIPVGNAALRFQLNITAASGNGVDGMLVMLDGQSVFGVRETEMASYNPWTEVNIDISRFADGREHILVFESTTSGPLRSNFFVDAVEIDTIGVCVGDLDGDGDTDLADLGILLADFGCPQPGPCVGDLDGDGDTDLADLGILLADFGCAP